MKGYRDLPQDGGDGKGDGTDRYLWRHPHPASGGVCKKIGCDVFEGVIYYGAMKNVVFEKCFLSE